MNPQERNNINLKQQDKVLYFFCLIGLGFLIFYIESAGYNIVYTDYIRIINRYILPERMPTFMEMWTPSAGHRALGYFPFLFLNVRFLALNTQFEMLLGILGVFFSSLVIVKFFIKKQLHFCYSLIALLLVFSLNKWELVLNGTGWTIFIAFACMDLNFLLIDAVFIDGDNSEINRWLLYVLPILNVFCFAGGYSVAYTIVTISILSALLFYGYGDTTKKNNSGLIIKLIGLFILAQIIYLYDLPLGAGTEKKSFFAVVGDNFPYLIKFLLASFASTIIGQETFFSGKVPEYWLSIIGIFVILSYLLAVYLYFAKKIYTKTLFPILLILFSLLSHGIILYTRYGFQTISYGMSSRYQPMYVMGIIGIFCIFSYCRKYEFAAKQATQYDGMRIVIFFILGAFVSGNLVTTMDELRKIPYRQRAYKEFETIALNYKNESDQTLGRLQENGSGVRIALAVLEKRNLNLFSRQAKNVEMRFPTKISGGATTLQGQYYSDGWISKQIRVKMRTGTSGQMSGSLYFPSAAYLPNGMSLFINNEKILEQQFATVGETTINAYYEPNQDVIVEIVMDKALIPKNAGLGQDQRELSVIIGTLKFE